MSYKDLATRALTDYEDRQSAMGILEYHLNPTIPLKQVTESFTLMRRSAYAVDPLDYDTLLLAIN